MTLPPRRKMVRPPTGGSEEGRGKPARLKTAKMRTPSSQAWLSRQINDPWAAKARAHGYRSRAAYKLTDIADRFGLLLPGQRVIDLGAAPGGWTQVALERGIHRIVGVDLLPVEPLPMSGFVSCPWQLSGMLPLQSFASFPYTLACRPSRWPRPVRTLVPPPNRNRLPSLPPELRQASPSPRLPS